MGLITFRCHISHEPVSRVTDLEGATVRMICDQLEQASGVCQLKRRIDDDGPLGQLLDRVFENTLDTRSIRCEFV